MAKTKLALGKLILLQIFNIGRIKAMSIELDPDTGTVKKLAGKNKAGKSTALNTLKYALEGAATIPKDLIRHGIYTEGKMAGAKLDRGSIRLETDTGMVIDRTVRTNKNGDQVEELTVVNTKGEQISGGAQSFLDSRISKYPSPNVIANKTSKELFAIMKDLLNIDTSDTEKKIADIKTDSTVLRKEIKNAGVLEKPEDLAAKDPGESEELMRQVNKQFEKLESTKKLHEDRKVLQAANLADKEHTVKEIAELKDSLELAEAQLQNIEAQEEKLNTEVPISAASVSEETEKYDELDKEFTSFNDRRKAFNLVDAYNKWTEKVTQLNKDLDGNKEKVEKLELKATDMICKAELPYVKMALTSAGNVILNDGDDIILWDNMAESERMTAAVHLCIDSIPADGLRCIALHRGESIGTELQNEIATIAHKKNCVVLMEIFSENMIDGVDVINIEEGIVVDPPAKNLKF